MVAVLKLLCFNLLSGCTFELDIVDITSNAVKGMRKGAENRWQYMRLYCLNISSLGKVQRLREDRGKDLQVILAGKHRWIGAYCGANTGAHIAAATFFVWPFPDGSRL